MAVLTSDNQAGAVVGDVFGNTVVKRVIADTDYIFGELTQAPTEEITADPAPAEVKNYEATYAVAGPFTLPALATLNVGETISFTNVDGTAITVTPAAGEILNGGVDNTFFSDSQRHRVVVEKVSATEWSVGPNVTSTASLARMSISADNSLEQFPNASANPYFIGDTLTDSGFNVVDPQGMLTVGSQSCVIPNTGDYFVAFAGAIDGPKPQTSLNVRVNGTETIESIIQGVGNSAEVPFRVQGVLSLTAGDALTFAMPAGGVFYSPSIQVIQLHDGAYQAGTLAASPLSRVSRHGTMNPGNGNPFEHATENLNKGDIAYAAGVYTIGSDGDYAIDYAIQGATGAAVGFVSASLFVNGVQTGPGVGVTNDGNNNFPFGGSADVSLALVAGDTVELRQTSSPGFSVAKTTSTSIRQLSTHTAIRAEDAPVVDQAASGYFDVGTMRMQWGVESGGIGVGTQTLTFPAPFAAGSSPTVTLTAQGGATNSEYIRLNAIPNPISVDLYRDSMDDTGSSWTAGDQIHWIAIGLKP